jgi:hypothetical protein
VRHVLWNHAPERVDILAIKGKIIRKHRLQQVVIQIEQALRALLHTGILGREARHEDGVLAVGVELGVDGALREDGHLVLGEFVADHGEAVLGDVLGAQGSLDDDVDFCGAGMGLV